MESLKWPFSDSQLLQAISLSVVPALFIRNLGSNSETQRLGFRVLDEGRFRYLSVKQEPCDVPLLCCTSANDTDGLPYS